MKPKGLSTGAVPIDARTYIDPSGMKVHRITSLNPYQLEQIRLKVEYATLWASGPFTRVIIINGPTTTSIE